MKKLGPYVAEGKGVHMREVRNENMLAEGKEKDDKRSEKFEKGNRWTSSHLVQFGRKTHQCLYQDVIKISSTTNNSNNNNNNDDDDDNNTKKKKKNKKKRNIRI